MFTCTREHQDHPWVGLDIHLAAVIQLSTDLEIGETSLKTTHDPSRMLDYDFDTFKLGDVRLVPRPLYNANVELIEVQNWRFGCRQGKSRRPPFLGGRDPRHVCSSLLHPWLDTYHCRSSSNLVPPVLYSWSHPCCRTGQFDVFL